MKIAVLIKQVPDTETKIRVNSAQTGIEEADIKYIINPYCEFAVEEAIRTKEKAGGGETVVISLGPDRSVEAIRTALAMGIDKAIHINTNGTPFDSFMTAKALAKVIKDNAFDIIFCGKQAIDGDNGQTPQMIAEFLDIIQIMIVEKVELSSDKKSASVTRRVSGGMKEVYDVELPAILGCETGLNQPRYASLPGIMKAKTKPVEKLNAADLLGGETAKVNFVNFTLPPEKQAGKKIEGDAPIQAKELIRLLREEAKVL